MEKAQSTKRTGTRAASTRGSASKLAAPAGAEETLRAELAAVQDQRRKDLERYKRTVQECDWLRLELAERNAEERQERVRAEGLGDMLKQEGWHLLPAAVRTAERKERPLKPSAFNRMVASLVLRFARRAARLQHYARAEAFYQTILQLRPRPFVWRQLGNMLAAQGLFFAAVSAFEQAIDLDEGDAEAHFLMGVSLRRMGEFSRSEAAFSMAIELDGSLISRPRG